MALPFLLLLFNRNHSNVIDDVSAAAAGGDHPIIASMSQESSELKSMNKSEGETMVEESGGGGGESVVNWQNAKCKADILAHPLYDQLLSAHVACLRIATPVDQLPRIDAQLAQSQQVVAKYSALGSHQGLVPDDKELDQFMPKVAGVLWLKSWNLNIFGSDVCNGYKEKVYDAINLVNTSKSNTQHFFEDWCVLNVHCTSLELITKQENLPLLKNISANNRNISVKNESELLIHITFCLTIVPSKNNCNNMFVVHAMEAELSPGEGNWCNNVTDDDEDQVDSEANMKQWGLGPLVPTESEKIFDEAVVTKRKLLTLERKFCAREERESFPEEDKGSPRLVQETGLQLKQINNWFINQRTRNWHSKFLQLLNSHKKQTQKYIVSNTTWQWNCKGFDSGLQNSSKRTIVLLLEMLFKQKHFPVLLFACPPG
ncbi:hypothetical protein NC652_017953 [Populus alba x Populus x berolinensis]|nr:hypothetical protein NC652_017953 [Populus alba x Populus x berolinensis]